MSTMFVLQVSVVCNRVLSYQGGSVWLRQDMGFDDVIKIVEGTIQEGL